MFPLGTVLLPHMVLPLHVFEPRYRTMMQELLEGDAEFGVTLIERGHEVGGGDERMDVGTVARLIQAEELDDGRWLVVGVGTRRFVVKRWLDDDPYPRAEVEDLPVEHVDEHETQGKLTEVITLLRRVLALQSELGEDGVESTFELATSHDVACWQAAVLAPITPFDAQRVLSADGNAHRLALLQELLEDAERTLQFRLEFPVDDGP